MDLFKLQSEADMKSMRSLIRYALISLAALALLASFLFGKNVELTSRPVPQAVKVDGLISEWPEGALSYLDDQEITVGMCNDTQNVYIMLCSRKPEVARLIRMTGVTVYLDSKGEKQKDFYVKLVAGPTREQIQTVSGQTGSDSTREITPEMRDRMRQREANYKPEFLCFQKDVIAEKPIPMDGTEGPAAAFGIDKGFFVYEFSVPLAQSGVRQYGLGVPPNRKIGVGLVWGEFDKDKMRERMGEGGGGDMGQGRPGGMPGGGGEGGRGGGGWGGRGGGGMRGGGGGERGGMGGPGGGRMGEMAKKQEVWLKVQLMASNTTGTSTESGK
jgi:hypothetical protein